MIVILERSNFSFNKSLIGKRVVATKNGDNGISVRVAELVRVGVKISQSSWAANDRIYFTSEEYHVVSPRFVNCSELGVGKGWEGWYDQAHVKTSSFR
jgi:hypothetical protein